MDGMQGWWTVVSFGGAMDPRPAPPRGPWASREGAEAALGRWGGRLESRGWQPYDYIAMHSVRVVGPFRTRADARAADISDWPATLRASWAGRDA